jgi:hypothetical protein
MTQFLFNYMATCFGYLIAILRPMQNNVQAHKVRTQWDPISFTNRDIPSSSSIGTTTLVGFQPAQLSLSILSRKVLQSAVASGTSNPQLRGEPGI